MGPKSNATMKYLMTHYNRTGHNIASTSRVPVIVQFWNPGLEEVETEGGNGRKWESERGREREREGEREKGRERGKDTVFIETAATRGLEIPATSMLNH